MTALKLIYRIGNPGLDELLLRVCVARAVARQTPALENVEHGEVIEGGERWFGYRQLKHVLSELVVVIDGEDEEVPTGAVGIADNGVEPRLQEFGGQPCRIVDLRGDIALHRGRARGYGEAQFPERTGLARQIGR